MSGLSGSGLVLQNNVSDSLNLAQNGNFTFAQPLASGANYNVTVATNPSSPTQVCTVANGAGTVADSNVSNITVSCVTSAPVSSTSSGGGGSGGGGGALDEEMLLLALLAMAKRARISSRPFKT